MTHFKNSKEELSHKISIRVNGNAEAGIQYIVKTPEVQTKEGSFLKRKSVQTRKAGTIFFPNGF